MFFECLWGILFLFLFHSGSNRHPNSDLLGIGLRLFFFFFWYRNKIKQLQRTLEITKHRSCDMGFENCDAASTWFWDCFLCKRKKYQVRSWTRFLYLVLLLLFSLFILFFIYSLAALRTITRIIGPWCGANGVFTGNKYFCTIINFILPIIIINN